MTNLYDNKIYPPISNVLPENIPADTAQNYKLLKVSKIKQFFLDEIEQYGKIAKKDKTINSTIFIADTDLIITTVFAGLTSIATFAKRS